MGPQSSSSINLPCRQKHNKILHFRMKFHHRCNRHLTERRNFTKRPNIVSRPFSSVLKVIFLGNLIEKQHTFLQALPHPDRLPGKVTKIHFIMYSWHNLDNRRCKKRGKLMENSNPTYRP